MASYVLQPGTVAGAIEVVFAEKPAEAIREALKSLKFRWNGKKGVWYGFSSEDAINAALSGQQTTDSRKADKKPIVSGINYEALKKYGGEHFDGCMGATGWRGNQYGGYGSSLTKAIRAAFKECNIPGVTVSIKTYAGGQTLNVTIKEMPGDFYALDEFKARYISDDYIDYYMLLTFYRDWIYYTEITPDGERKVKDIHRSAFEAIENPATKNQIFHSALEYMYHQMTSDGINEFHLDRYDDFFTPRFKWRLNAIMQIVDSFNYRDINSMVDYYNQRFSVDYYIKNTIEDSEREPWQPTEEELQRIETEKAEKEQREKERIQREKEEQEAARAEFEAECILGACTIRRYNNLYPVDENKPTCKILWSEHPAFHGYKKDILIESGELKPGEEYHDDCNLTFSLRAADRMLEALDEEMTEKRGYYKTKFEITMTNPEDADDPYRYTGRYDIGDGDGGVLNHIKILADYYATHDAHGHELPEPITDTPEQQFYNMLSAAI